MGLTIHYSLSFKSPYADIESLLARHAVGYARDLALKYKKRKLFQAVTPMGFDPSARRFAVEYLSVPIPNHPHSFYGVEVRPTEGFLFGINVGRDCEPLWIGLCRYPATAYTDGRYIKTKMEKQWVLKRFSKTQFAGLHGWEHFQRCHCAIIDYLDALKEFGISVKISDEGEYWPRRSLGKLRRNLDQMNGVVAAAAGILKDANDATGGGSPIQSPVFKHPRFEHLEAAGEEVAKPLKKLLKRC